MIALVGVACARQEARLGLARGVLDADGKLCVQRATLGSAGESAAATVAGWLEGSTRRLLALDAPLGWPVAMGPILIQHQVGEEVPSVTGPPFRRATDDFVARSTGRMPPEIGADRVAYRALTALRLLAQVRRLVVGRLPVAWDQARDSGAIEVNPNATIRAHGLVVSGYRGRSARGRELRSNVVDLIERRCELWVPRALLLEDGALLDAVVAVLAAADFGAAACTPPSDLAQAQKEGWIWLRQPVSRVEGERQGSLF